MRNNLRIINFLALFIGFFIFSFNAIGQNTVNIFVERFDSPTVKMTSSSLSGLNNNAWGISTTLGMQNTNSDTAQVIVSETLYLTSDTIDATGYVSVLLSFDHIAKIEGQDKAYVEVSIDKGLSWTHLGPNNTFYQGSSAAFASDSVFNELKNPFLWLGIPSGNNPTTYPSPSWFVQENFDISELVAGQKNILVRFALQDGFNSGTGAAGRKGWFLDNVIVAGSTCELLPPNVSIAAPTSYPGAYGNGRVYDTGPYVFVANVLDQSGILKDSTYLEYSRWDGNGVFISSNRVPMVNVSSANYRGVIPAANVGDSIRYKMRFMDSSGCDNITFFPTVGERYMKIRHDLPQPCVTTPEFTFPHFEDFETFEIDLTGKLYNNWINAQGDLHDWQVGVDTTPTNFTGPAGRGKRGGHSGRKFLYLEATGHVGQEAHLLSPCLDFYETPNPTLEFWYHMRGPHIDTLHIDLYDETTQSWVLDIVSPIGGNQGNVWKLKQANFYNYRNQIAQVRFRAKAGKGGDVGDICIDDFRIYNGPIYNAAVVKIVNTPFTPTTPQNVTFTLENFGVLDITSLPAQYNIYDPQDNVIASGNHTFNSLTVNPSQQIDLTFPTTYTPPNKEFKIEVIVNLPNDTANLNDTNNALTYGLNKRSATYYDNFDNPARAIDWTSYPVEPGVVSKWKRYQPTATPGVPNYAFSEPWVWGVNGNQKYSIGIDNSLISPFIDMSNTDSAFMQFESFRDIAGHNNGLGGNSMHMEYSIDRGATWKFLPDDNNPPATLNWYTGLDTSTGIPGWLDSTKGWEKSRIKITYLDDEPEVLFKFRFSTDSLDNFGYGPNIDNFSIINPEPIDIAVTGVFEPFDGCELDQLPVTFKLENYGKTPVNSIPVKVNIIDNASNTVLTTFTETVNVNLNVFDTVRYTTTNKAVFPKLGTFRVEVISQATGDTGPLNDTAFKNTDSYYGCTLTVKAFTDVAIGKGSWEIYENGSPTEARLLTKFDSLTPLSTYVERYCVRDSTEIKINLKDPDKSLTRFEVSGYGVNYWLTLGGFADVNSSSYDWICPAMLSMGVEKVELIGLEGNMPLAIDYPIRAHLLDNGLDSIHNVEVNLQIDNNPVITEKDTFNPELRFKDRRVHNFKDVWTATPGRHYFKVWTSNPNDGNVPDTRASDDTISFNIDIIDTIKMNQVNPYCNSFDQTPGSWRALNAYTYKENVAMVNGTPNKTVFNSNHSGASSWVTVLDTTYGNYDSSAVTSDFIEMVGKSCYEVTFWHRFLTEEDNDGGQFQYSSDNGKTWNTLYDYSGEAQNWYNTDHIAAIIGNTQNGGWTGNSNGWLESKNVIGFQDDTKALFRFRFESDGSVVDEGWQIDDFCMDSISRTDSNKYKNCFPVGLDEFDNKNVSLSNCYPNPSGDISNVTFGLKKSGQINFTVINMMGQQFYNESEFKAAGEHLIQINVNNWADGVYFYSIEFEGERIVKKMVVRK